MRLKKDNHFTFFDKKQIFENPSEVDKPHPKVPLLDPEVNIYQFLNSVQFCFNLFPRQVTKYRKASATLQRTNAHLKTGHSEY